jgi:hypothetical protein
MAPANEFPGNIFFYLVILGFGAFFALTVIMRLIPFVQGKRVSRLDHLPARVRASSAGSTGTPASSTSSSFGGSWSC